MAYGEHEKRYKNQPSRSEKMMKRICKRVIAYYMRRCLRFATQSAQCGVCTFYALNKIVDLRVILLVTCLLKNVQ